MVLDVASDEAFDVFDGLPRCVHMGRSLMEKRVGLGDGR